MPVRAPRRPQLVKRGIIDDVFSLCFGYPKDGILLLGVCYRPGPAPLHSAQSPARREGWLP